MNINSNYSKLKFVKSIMCISDRSIKSSFEVAFYGYSNTGKSSVINLLANYKKKCARVSKNPGRTRALNIFKIFSDYHIVDLPGYGYSNMSKQTKIYWNKMIFKYLMFRRSLKGIVLCMDIRNPIKLLDQKVLKIVIKKN